MNQIRSTLLLASLAGALAAAVPAGAQTIPPSAYGALRWRLIGPHPGGRGLAGGRLSRGPPAVFFRALGGGGGGPPKARGSRGPPFYHPPVPPLRGRALPPP